MQAKIEDCKAVIIILLCPLKLPMKICIKMCMKISVTQIAIFGGIFKKFSPKCRTKKLGMIYYHFGSFALF